MDTKTFATAALMITLGFSAAAANAQFPNECKATVDLLSGRTSDKIRITNQGFDSHQVLIRVMDAKGNTQGSELSPQELEPNQSITNSVAAIFAQAKLRTFNPAYLIQIEQESGLGGPFFGWTPQFQATYITMPAGPVLPVVFTCPDTFL